MVPLCAAAADDKILVELNTVESSENRCRMNFVVENRSEGALDSMKLDLVVFGADGGIMRRLIIEMAPLRPVKTVVRAFLVDAECRQIGAILVNDVAACAGANPKPAWTGSSCPLASRTSAFTSRKSAPRLKLIVLFTVAEHQTLLVARA